jgi:hypothetical protein
MKSCPVEAKLFYGDGRTDTTEFLVAFRNFRKALKMTSTRIATLLRTPDAKIVYQMFLCHFAKYLLIDRTQYLSELESSKVSSFYLVL